MEDRERNIYLYAIIISILLHLLGLLLFGVFKVFSFTPSPDLLQQEVPPIVLELEPPELPEPQKQPLEEIPLDESRLYEVVENESADEQNPEFSNLLSFRSSRSASPDVSNPEKALAPRDDKNPDRSKEMVTTEEPLNLSKTPEEVPDLSGSVSMFALKNQRQFSKELLTDREQSLNEEKKTKEVEEASRFTQKEFEADLIGEMRLSTYAWEWAPWVLAFQRKIYQFWYVPSAFYMGLIDGRTYVKIKVSREGELLEYQILKHIGHESLRESSVNVLESVFPFKALPPDFPDQYLELHFVLIYPNLKELYGNRE